MSSRQVRLVCWFLVIAGLVSFLPLFVLAEGHERQLSAFFLLWIIPAGIWTMALRGELLLRFAGGAGIALLIPVLLALIASYLPGPLTSLYLALTAVVSLLAPLLAWSTRRPDSSLHAPAGSRKVGRRSPSVVSRQPSGAGPAPDQRSSWTRQQWLALLLVLALAAALRAANMSYKEFQGDEGVIMVRAAQALLGDEMALLRHQKGPVEILLPLIPWGLAGNINELWARAVFTWAGWLTVGAMFLLGRRFYDSATGILSAFLFAIGGFGIAFSRIVQYQSLVMLWTLLSLIFAHRYQRRGAYLDLILSVTFLAGALLAHYDAILAAPAIGWLLIMRWRQGHARWRAHVLTAALLGVTILTLFYGPYLAGPTAGGTGSYLLQDRIGGRLFSWSLPQGWRMATFYNSTYYVLLLVFFAAAGVFARKRSSEHVTTLLLLVVPLVFYTVVVADPRTHVYTIFPGLSLLGAAGVVSLWRRMHAAGKRQASLARYVGLPLVALLLVASLLYVFLMFVDITPERQRTWSENRPPYFPTTWSQPPEYGLFGFPHQAGWRLAPALVDDFPYSSNEEPEITDWYMAQAPRTHCPDFQTFLVAANAQDAIPYDQASVDNLPLQTTVTVNGVPSLHIYGDDSPPVARAFMPESVEATGHDLWRAPQQVAPPKRMGDVAVNAVLGNHIRLLGYTLQRPTAQPGGAFDVILYWQALAPVSRNYQVFVHLYDGTMWAQHDGAPNCDTEPTSGWEPGQIVRDAHRLELATDTPITEIPLLVGMYDLISQDRLQVDETGRDLIHLTNVQVNGPAP